MWNVHNTVLGEEALLIYIVPVFNVLQRITCVTIMRYINVHFTYLLVYLLTPQRWGVELGNFWTAVTYLQF